MMMTFVQRRRFQQKCMLMVAVKSKEALVARLMQIKMELWMPMISVNKLLLANQSIQMAAAIVNLILMTMEFQMRMIFAPHSMMPSISISIQYQMVVMISLIEIMMAFRIRMTSAITMMIRLTLIWMEFQMDAMI